MKAKIIFICMIFVVNRAFCQHITDKATSTNDFYRLNPASKTDGNISINKYFHKTVNKKPAQPLNYNSDIPLNPASVIRANYYTRNFGFFCKKELQFEKATRVPFKFRIGSVQYCDWMEGKPNAGILPRN